MEEKLWTCFES